MTPQAVLLLGFGGPTSFEEVRPFILNVTRGRQVSQERIEAVIQQYRQIGGKSPFRELTEQQARALAAQLALRGWSVPVEVGFLYWSPYIADTIGRLVDEAVSHVVAIVMAPQRTEASFERYIAAVNQALLSKPRAELSIEFAPCWHNHPLFIEAIAEQVEDKLASIQLHKLPDGVGTDCIRPGACNAPLRNEPEIMQAGINLDDVARSQTRLIFTAHSVPVEMSDASGYGDQVTLTAKLVAARVSMPDWRVAFQSRSGDPRQAWLEPDIRDVIAEAAKDGIRNVIVCPVGFVCDHVEVLFDLDHQAAEFAQSVGVRMLRAATVGDNPKFISMLAEILLARVGAP